MAGAPDVAGATPHHIDVTIAPDGGTPYDATIEQSLLPRFPEAASELAEELAALGAAVVAVVVTGWERLDPIIATCEAGLKRLLHTETSDVLMYAANGRAKAALGEH